MVPPAARRVASVADPPARLFVQVFPVVRQIMAVEQHRASGKRRTTESIAPSVRMENPPAIIVTEKRQDSRRSHQRGKVISHAPKHRCWNRAADGAVEQEPIERVDVIVRGLFEVTPVSTDLSVDRNGDGRSSGLNPTRGMRQRRKQRAETMERDRLSE